MNPQGRGGNLPGRNRHRKEQMTPLSIDRFRRLTLALIALLFVGFAFSSISSAEDFRIDRSVYRISLSGTYTKAWQGQTIGFPDPYTPWSTEKGKTVSKWALPGKGVKFAGSRFIGDLPGSTPLPKFQFGSMRATVAKAKNRSGFDRKVNFYEGCGGELGECTGNEKQGTESLSKSCKKKGRIPIDFKYDDSGRKPMVEIEFGHHNSMTDFCGKKYPDDDDTIDEGLKLKWPDGLDVIMKLKVGEAKYQKGKTERGWVGGDGHPKGARHVRPCPSMTGVGSRYCRVNEFRFEIKRLK
jgi:hypothetical protein